MNKDYQKLLKELSALKQTKAGAAQTIYTGQQLPADSAEQHCRDADAYAANDDDYDEDCDADVYVDA